jgi:hypothetical protein
MRLRVVTSTCIAALVATGPLIGIATPGGAQEATAVDVGGRPTASLYVEPGRSMHRAGRNQCAEGVVADGVG